MDFKATYQWHLEQNLEQVWSRTPVPFLNQTTTHKLKSVISNQGRNPGFSNEEEKRDKTKTKTRKANLLQQKRPGIPDEAFVSNLNPELAELYQEIRNFDGCELRETALNTVIADGDARSPVLFIGEAPGAREDRSGRPFTGDAGQLLNRMIRAIDLEREKVLVSNLVFWRPPGNRKPTRIEIEACLPFIKRQIEIVKPRIMIFVGALSAQSLLQTTEGITRIRGNWYDYHLEDGFSVCCLPVLHPAYLLRQPRYKRESWIDFLAIKNKLLELDIFS